MNKLTIKEAGAEDAALIFEFIKELAEYERLADQVTGSVEMVRASLFGSGACARAVVATYEGSAAGFAVYYYGYSTFMAQRSLQLEDLYVRSAHRGKGIGKAMLAHLAQVAVAEKCGRFEWSVLDWNQPSIEFYDSLGALPQKEWIRYRLCDEALLRLAESRPTIK